MKTRIIITLLTAAMIAATGAPVYASSPGNSIETSETEQEAAPETDQEMPEGQDQMSMPFEDMQSQFEQSLTDNPTYSHLGDITSSINDIMTAQEGFERTFQEMRSQLENGETMKLSKALQKTFQTIYPEELLTSMSDIAIGSSFDTGLLNMQYISAANLIGSLSGTVEDKSGNASNCVDAFKNAYNTSSLQNDAEAVRLMTDSLYSTYQGALLSEDVMDVKDSINLSDLFANSNGKAEYGNISNGRLQRIISGDSEPSSFSMGTAANKAVLQSIDFTSILGNVSANDLNKMSAVDMKKTMDQALQRFGKQ